MRALTGACGRGGRVFLAWIIGAAALWVAAVPDAEPATASVPANTVVELQVTGRGGVPADATAVILNLAAVDPTAHGYVTAYPCGTERPLASTINYVPGVTVANNATVAVGEGGKVCLYTLAGTDLIADLNGWFLPHPEFTPRSPERLLDTRLTTRPVADDIVEVQVTGRGGVPADAEAAVINVAAVDPGDFGYVTAFPCGTLRPHASTINYTPGITIANNTTVAIGEGGKVCLYVKAGTDLIADLNGWYSPGDVYTARSPERLVDTRLTTSIAAETYVPIDVVGRAGVPEDATAVVLNLAAVDPRGHGYVTAYPCGRVRPTASTINYRPDVTIANNATVAVGVEGKVCVFSKAEIDLVADIGGWYVGDELFSARSPERLLDTRDPDLGPGPGPGGATTTTVPGGGGGGGGGSTTTTTTVPGGGGGTTTTTVPGGGGGGGGGGGSTTTLPPPTVVDPEYFESFDDGDGLGRLITWMYHRDDLLVAQTQWPGDHDEACGDASTQRIIPRSDFTKANYICDGHLMTAIGDTSGYSLAYFAPDADFDGQSDTFVRSQSPKVGWDVSITDLGSRLWWEVMIVPVHAPYLTTADYLVEVAHVPGYHPGTVAVGNGPLGGDGSVFAGGVRHDPFGVFSICDTDPEGCATKELRRRFSIVDNLNGTVSVDFLGRQHTYPGRFPERYQVYFKAHAFTPNADGPPPGYTWHWDNIVIE